MRGDSRQGWRAEATTQRGWRHGQRCARVLNRHHAHMECANAAGRIAVLAPVMGSVVQSFVACRRSTEESLQSRKGDRAISR